MANPSRLEDVFSTTPSLPESITAVEMAERLDIGYHTAARHLRTLARSGRLEFELKDRKRYYSRA